MQKEKYGLADIYRAVKNLPTEDWISVKVQRPPMGIVVDTKLDDASGSRNEQRLKLVSNLWFVPDGSMYVYYEPTHWKYIQPE